MHPVIAFICPPCQDGDHAQCVSPDGLGCSCQHRVQPLQGLVCRGCGDTSGFTVDLLEDDSIAVVCASCTTPGAALRLGTWHEIGVPPLWTPIDGPPPVYVPADWLEHATAADGVVPGWLTDAQRRSL